MRRRPATSFLLATLAASWTGAGAPEEARATERPAYEAVEQTESYELRRYAPQVLAEVRSEAGFDGAGNEAFRVLFRYIGGENETAREMAMTAPVVQQPSRGQKLAMTAPVTQQPAGDGDSHVVAFILPREIAFESAPRPRDPRVQLRRVPERLLAVRRYRGGWSESRYRREEASLLAAVAAAGLERSGEPIFARYDSPFMPWLFRTNEVMVEVRPREPGADTEASSRRR